MGVNKEIEGIVERRINIMFSVDTAMHKYAKADLRSSWDGSAENPNEVLFGTTKDAVLVGIAVAFATRTRSELIADAQAYAAAKRLPESEDRRALAEACIEELGTSIAVNRPSLKEPEKPGLPFRVSIAQALGKLELACNLDTPDLNFPNIDFEERLKNVGNLTEVAIYAWRAMQLAKRATPESATPHRR